MKTKLLFGFFSILLLTGCIKGAKVDVLKGISYTFNGFILKDVETYDTYERLMAGNELPENSILYVKFKEVRNFTNENGKVFPGCSLKVTDENGKVVLNEADLYATYTDGADAAGFTNPYIKVRLSDPVVGGKNYNVEIHFYDKKKPENVIDAKIKIKLTSNGLKVEQKTEGLTPESILFGDSSTGLLPSNIVKLNSKAAVILNNVEGFTESNGKVFPGCEISVTDKSGSNVLHADDIYKDNDGYTLEQINQLLAIVTYTNPIVAGETYTVKLRLFDKKDTSKQLNVSMDIDVIE